MGSEPETQTDVDHFARDLNRKLTPLREPYMDVREGPDKAPEKSLNTFYRMLAHKLADYYHMTHTYEPSADGVRIYRTPFCRVPPSLAQVVAGNNSSNNAAPPAILPKKIMKRGEDAESSQQTPSPSKESSEAVDDTQQPVPAKERLEL